MAGSASKTRYWIAVASKDHVHIGVQGGFAQFCHGKQGPAKRVSKGDWVLYYSAKQTMNTKTPYQRFTAIGEVQDEEAKQVAQQPGFCPYRRKTNYRTCKEVEVKPLLQQLSFVKNKDRWGMAFRRGFFEIQQHDFHILAEKMLIDASSSNAT